jgi:hypothetical protein
MFVRPIRKSPLFPVTHPATINPIIVSANPLKTLASLIARVKPVATMAVVGLVVSVPPERPVETTNANAYRKHVHRNCFIVVKTMMTVAAAPSPVLVFALHSLPVVRGFAEVLQLLALIVNAPPFQGHREKECTPPEAAEATSVMSPT